MMYTPSDLVCDYEPFCVSSAYAPAAQLLGMVVRLDAQGRRIEASPEAVNRLGVAIDWLASDNFLSIPAERLWQTCQNDACVVFRVSCKGLTCTWQAAALGGRSSLMLEELRITATTRAALVAAKAHVFVNTPRGPIALTDLAEGDPAPPLEYSAPPTPAELTDPPYRRRL